MMPCPTLISPACKIAEKAAEVGGGKVAGSVVHSGLEVIAKQISEAVSWLVRSTVAWWVGVPSVDVARQPVVEHLRSWFLPIALAVTIAGLIAAGARMAAARKANPLIDVTGGLLVIAVVGAIGVTAPSLLLKAGDAWSNWVLARSTGHAFGQRMADVLSMQAADAGLVVVLGIVALLMATVQAILMLFRETAILILIGMLPLAAAGAMSPGMRGWIKRVAAWLLALIMYKPAAAAVYATAFTLIGHGNGLRAVLMGFCALLLSLVALPVLIKFFTFATGSVGQQAGGGMLGAAVGAMVAVGSVRSGGGGGSAVAQAEYASSRMPPPSGGSAGGAAGGSPSGFGGGPDGAHPTQAAGAGSARSGGTASTDSTASPQRDSAGSATGTATSGSTGTTSGVTSTGSASTAPGAATGAAPTAAGSAAGGSRAAATGATASGAAAAGGPIGAAVVAGADAGRRAIEAGRGAAGSAMTPDGSEER